MRQAFLKTRALSLTTLLLLLSGCSAESSFEGVSAPREDGTPAGTLRLDVTPPTTEGAILLQQSHLLPPDAYEGVGLELLGTRSVSGVLTAQVARGWSFGAPTSPEPLVAGILALPEGDLQGAIAQSGEDGAFVLSFPAYHTPIEVAFVPVDAGMAPILVLEAPTYDRTGWNQEILPGIPVYGRVTGLVDGLEQPLAGITLRISQVVGGQAVSSAAFTTDRTGWYVARVQDLGEYTIEVEGGASTAADRMVPTLSVPVLVEADEGVELPITLGHVQAASADGSVVDFDGDRVVNALIRFTSVSLDSGVGALTVETDTNGEGRFITDLLPGVYDIEIMPAYDTNVTASPARYDRQRISDGINLPNLLVQAPARLSGRVLNASEDPAADVQVVATEVGFGGNVYFARTGQDGAFDFPVTDVPLTVTLTPSRSEDGAVTTVDVAEPGAIGAFVLDAGVPLDGKVTYEGTDIAYASVDVYDAGSGLLLGRTISDEAGYFSLRVSLPEASLDTADTGADTAADTGADTADTAR
ncbi:MAG: hypothetical protein Q8P18_28640 [Pseudomonadota bacterium]|nr:hypothetical protein [Pseudomonadota bacterium]